MTLSYDIIFSNFLGNITEYDFVKMDATDVNEIMVEKLHSVLAEPYIRRLFSSAVLDDEVQTFSFEMEYSVEESADIDFVVEVLSKGMVVKWLDPQVKSKVNIAQMFGTKEQKNFSQSSHLKEIKDLLHSTKYDVRALIRDRGYINNTYLDS